MALVKPEVAPAVSSNPIVGNAYSQTDTQAPPYQAEPPLVDENGNVVGTATADPYLTAAVPAPAPVQTQITQAPANAPMMANNQIMQQLAAKGLTFDFTSYPTIKLPDGHGYVDSDKEEYGKSFQCKIVDCQQRWLYKGSKLHPKDNAPIAYSDNQVETTNGELVAEVLANWQREGRTTETKRYMMVYVIMEAPGEVYDGEFRVLSVPGTSIGRLTAHTEKLLRKFGAFDGGITQVSVGKEVTAVANPFFPWAFSIAD
jgi:hypothetical protein